MFLQLGTTLDNGRLVVRYREDGELRRRYVALPSGAGTGADDKIERAKHLLEERNVTVE